MLIALATCGLLLGICAIAISAVRGPESTPAGERTTMQRIERRVPEEPKTPEPTPAPSEGPGRSGSSEGSSRQADSAPKTERHEIHGSGTIGVVSGTVDPGKKTGGGYVVGSPKPAGP